MVITFFASPTHVLYPCAQRAGSRVAQKQGSAFTVNIHNT